MENALAYLSLFAVSLVAGTFLPFVPASSEMTLAALIAADAGTPAALVGTAVAANALGASVNYTAGSHLSRLSGRRWFPLSREALDKAAAFFRRYGIWAVALCWLPTFGDAITVVAGLLRADFRLFVALVLAGRLFGHSAVASGVSWFV